MNNNDDDDITEETSLMKDTVTYEDETEDNQGR